MMGDGSVFGGGRGEGLRGGSSGLAANGLRFRFRWSRMRGRDVESHILKSRLEGGQGESTRPDHTWSLPRRNQCFTLPLGGWE